LPKGYVSKLIGVKPQRRIAMMSMGPIFGALGIYCVMFEDAEATARLRARLRPRNNSYSRRSVATYLTLTPRFMQKIGRKGAQARIDNSTKAQRQEWARAMRQSHAGEKPTDEAPAVLSADGQAPLRRRAPRPGA
jgi:hypothetical protein